jgi:hypothetical protein
MGFVGLGLQSIAGIVSLVCFIMVLIRIFQSGQTALGVVCIVLLFCVGIGSLIAFVYGWMRAKDWNITNLMIIWSVAIVIGILGGIISPSAFAFKPAAP